MKFKLGQLKKVISETVYNTLSDDPLELDESIKGSLRAAIISALMGMAGNVDASQAMQDTSLTATGLDSEPDEGDIIILLDDDGNEHRYEWVIEVSVDGQDYAVLLSLDQGTPPEESLFFYKYTVDDDGNERFDWIEDDATWERVRVAAEEKLNER